MKSRFFFIFALVSFMTPALAMADDGTLGQSNSFEPESVLCQKYAEKNLGSTATRSASNHAKPASEGDSSGQI